MRTSVILVIVKAALLSRAFGKNAEGRQENTLLEGKMSRIHIVGRQNHGKTTLIVELIEEFARRGIAVGTIKHSGHAHELDTPGKDSYRHRRAGAAPAAVIASETIGVWMPRPADADPYALLAPIFSACRLVLVEGHLDADGAKIEVWRQAAGGPLLAETHNDIRAVVTDDRVDARVPLWPRHEVSRLAERILDLAGVV
jgi:molybdopterin-guanine dinucleotide biosynthesis adapter protein